MDIVNAFFEISGGFFIALSIRQVLRQRMVRGVHWAHFLFFAVWGFWNLPYYASLGQWFSMAGSIGVCLANCVYLCLLVKYRRA